MFYRGCSALPLRQRLTPLFRPLSATSPTGSQHNMAQEQVDPAKLAQMIEYSEKYQDETFEYRCVLLAPLRSP